MTRESAFQSNENRSVFLEPSTLDGRGERAAAGTASVRPLEDRSRTAVDAGTDAEWNESTGPREYPSIVTNSGLR